MDMTFCYFFPLVDHMLQKWRTKCFWCLRRASLFLRNPPESSSRVFVAEGLLPQKFLWCFQYHSVSFAVVLRLQVPHFTPSSITASFLLTMPQIYGKEHCKILPNLLSFEGSVSLNSNSATGFWDVFLWCSKCGCQGLSLQPSFSTKAEEQRDKTCKDAGQSGRDRDPDGSHFLGTHCHRLSAFWRKDRHSDAIASLDAREDFPISAICMLICMLLYLLH